MPDNSANVANIDLVDKADNDQRQTMLMRQYFEEMIGLGKLPEGIRNMLRQRIDRITGDDWVGQAHKSYLTTVKTVVLLAEEEEKARYQPLLDKLENFPGIALQAKAANDPSQTMMMRQYYEALSGFADIRGDIRTRLNQRIDRLSGDDWVKQAHGIYLATVKMVFMLGDEKEKAKFQPLLDKLRGFTGIESPEREKS